MKEGLTLGIQEIMQYISQYGMMFLFFIIFLEYLNFPGLGAAIIMPAAGVVASKSGTNFFVALGVSILAGVIASYILYAISYYFGNSILDKIYKKFPKTRKSIEKTYSYVEKYGNKGVLVTRLVPVGRTLIPFVAGTFRMNIVNFTIYSTIGIAIWNAIFIYAGYAFGYFFV